MSSESGAISDGPRVLSVLMQPSLGTSVRLALPGFEPVVVQSLVATSCDCRSGASCDTGARTGPPPRVELWCDAGADAVDAGAMTPLPDSAATSALYSSDGRWHAVPLQATIPIACVPGSGSDTAQAAAAVAGRACGCSRVATSAALLFPCASFEFTARVVAPAPVPTAGRSSGGGSGVGWLGSYGGNSRVEVPAFEDCGGTARQGNATSGLLRAKPHPCLPAPSPAASRRFVEAFGHAYRTAYLSLCCPGEAAAAAAVAADPAAAPASDPCCGPSVSSGCGSRGSKGAEGHRGGGGCRSGQQQPRTFGPLSLPHLLFGSPLTPEGLLDTVAAPASTAAASVLGSSYVPAAPAAGPVHTVQLETQAGTAAAAGSAAEAAASTSPAAAAAARAWHAPSPAPDERVAAEASYVAALLHSHVMATQHNCPHAGEREVAVALAELLVALPQLRSGSARVRLLARLSGLDSTAAAVLLDRVGRLPPTALAAMATPDEATAVARAAGAGARHPSQPAPPAPRALASAPRACVCACCSSVLQPEAQGAPPAAADSGGGQLLGEETSVATTCPSPAPSTASLRLTMEGGGLSSSGSPSRRPSGSSAVSALSAADAGTRPEAASEAVALSHRRSSGSGGASGSGLGDATAAVASVREPAPSPAAFPASDAPASPLSAGNAAPATHGGTAGAGKVRQPLAVRVARSRAAAATAGSTAAAAPPALAAGTLAAGAGRSVDGGVDVEIESIGAWMAASPAPPPPEAAGTPLALEAPVRSDSSSAAGARPAERQRGGCAPAGCALEAAHAPAAIAAPAAPRCPVGHPPRDLDSLLYAPGHGIRDMALAATQARAALAQQQQQARPASVADDARADSDSAASRPLVECLRLLPCAAAAPSMAAVHALAQQPDAAGLTPFQRALLLLARWASGSHWDLAASAAVGRAAATPAVGRTPQTPGSASASSSSSSAPPPDPLQPLALELLVACLQSVSPAAIHRAVIMHILQQLCSSPPTSLTRVYLARGIKALFARGETSAGHAATASGFGLGAPLPLPGAGADASTAAASSSSSRRHRSRSHRSTGSRDGSRDRGEAGSDAEEVAAEGAGGSRRERGDRGKDREREGKDREREGKDREREGKDREREGKDREREGKDREREGRDRERERGKADSSAAAGSAGSSSRVRRAHHRAAPVPNLPRAVVVAVHDLIFNHLADVHTAQERARRHELSNLPPSVVQVAGQGGPSPDGEALGGRAASGASMGAGATEEPSPRWRSLTPRLVQVTGARAQRAASGAGAAARPGAASSPDGAAEGEGEGEGGRVGHAFTFTPVHAAAPSSSSSSGGERAGTPALAADRRAAAGDSPAPPGWGRGEGRVTDEGGSAPAAGGTPAPGTPLPLSLRTPVPTRGVAAAAAAAAGASPASSTSASSSASAAGPGSAAGSFALDTSAVEGGFDLAVLMGFIGDLLTESKGAARAVVSAQAAAAALAAEPVDAAASAGGSGSSCSKLSCNSCGGPCAIRVSTLTVTTAAAAAATALEVAAAGAGEGAAAAGPAPPGGSPFSLHQLGGLGRGLPPALSLPTVQVPAIAMGSRLLKVDEVAAAAAAAQEAAGAATPAEAAAAGVAGGGFLSPLATSPFPIPAGDALFHLCPSADKGGPSLPLWIEAARAVAHAAVKLSACIDAGEQMSADYKAVLSTALQLSSSCPLLREVVLRRILRRWPEGSADNECALLEFLAAVLATTTAAADLRVTDLRGLMLRTVTRCLRSPHLKVARNALVLVDPSRRLIDFLVDDPDSIFAVVRALAHNVRQHWSPFVRRASASLLTLYTQELDDLRIARGLPPVTASPELVALLQPPQVAASPAPPPATPPQSLHTEQTTQQPSSGAAAAPAAAAVGRCKPGGGCRCSTEAEAMISEGVESGGDSASGCS